MIGSTVSHYRVLDKLGAGGMGVVYRAEDLRLGRHVAIKFLPETASTDPLAVERFEREARTASALNHPHICTIHDVGHDNGRRFIVMELIDGVTLDRLIAAGPLGMERVIEIGIQVADALDAAHAEGILHRDIKPGNIFITRREKVKVVDFGLAKMMPSRGDAHVLETMAGPRFTTSVGIAVGTVAYMSPEHARGEPLDARSDLFSLGVVLYEMATGVQTFRGQTTAVVFDQILNRVPPAPSSVNPAIPPQLEQIVARALEKDRRMRYQSTRDLQADLERLLRDITTRRAVQAAAAGASAPTMSVAQSWASRNPSGPIDTLMLPGSAFAVPDAPAPQWSGPSGLASPPPDSEDVDRERMRAAAAALSAPASTPPLSAPPSAGVPVAHASQAVVIGAPRVDANAATIVAPSFLARHEADAIADSHAHANTVLSPSGTAPIALADTRATIPAAAALNETVARPSSPAPAARRISGRSLGPMAAVAAIAIVAVGVAGWWMLHRPEVSLGASATVAAPARPTSSTAPAASTPVSPAPVSTGVVGAAAAAAAPAPATAASNTPGSASRRTTTGAARATEAATALAGARALVASSPDDQAMSALEQVSVAYAGTPAATEALALTAELRQQRNELDAAINAWVAFAGRSGDPERGGEGLLRTADAAARVRSQANDLVARRALDELLTRFPTASRAVRAFQMKMALEDRLKLKTRDPQFPDTVPASVLTARTVAAQAGSAPVAELALWRLGGEYKDRRLHALAAQTFADLGTRFPNTRYDAWFSAAEIYDRQLKDAARARDAYLNVPPSSSHYSDAQRRARK
jgi:serine/threonine protein kinase